MIPKGLEKVEVKELFGTLVRNKIPVKGNIIKRFVNFNIVGMSPIAKPPVE